MLGTGSSRAKAYLMALAEAVRAAGLPKLPEDGAGLKDWLKSVDASKDDTARAAGRLEEAMAWSEMLASVTGSSDGLRTASQAKRLLLEHIEQKRQAARLEAKKWAEDAAFERGREAGLREAVRVIPWGEGFALIQPGSYTLKEDGGWGLMAATMRLPTREVAEAAKLACAPWWVNEDAK